MTLPKSDTIRVAERQNLIYGGILNKTKVYYSVTKIGRKENAQMKGIGYITDEDMIIACESKNNNPYIRVFEEAVKYCHSNGKTNEFKGTYSRILSAFCLSVTR